MPNQAVARVRPHETTPMSTTQCGSPDLASACRKDVAHDPCSRSPNCADRNVDRNSHKANFLKMSEGASDLPMLWRPSSSINSILTKMGVRMYGGSAGRALAFVEGTVHLEARTKRETNPMSLGSQSAYPQRQHAMHCLWSFCSSHASG